MPSSPYESPTTSLPSPPAVSRLRRLLAGTLAAVSACALLLVGVNLLGWNLYLDIRGPDRVLSLGWALALHHIDLHPNYAPETNLLGDYAEWVEVVPLLENDHLSLFLEKRLDRLQWLGFRLSRNEEGVGLDVPALLSILLAGFLSWRIRRPLPPK